LDLLTLEQNAIDIAPGWIGSIRKGVWARAQR
jgi:hypothetical protein